MGCRNSAISSPPIPNGTTNVPLLFRYASSDDFKGKASYKLNSGFPMYLISVPQLLRLEKMLPHQKLLDRGMLTKWTPEHKDRVMFISHEWLGFLHADPEGKQLAVLQCMLRELMDGNVSEVCANVDNLSKFKKNDLVVHGEQWAKALPWMYVWFDFISIPQVAGCDTKQRTANFKGELACAVDSIPAYVERSILVVILAPLCTHADKGTACSYGTWRSRGWCRLELQIALLADVEAKVMICEGRHAVPYFIEISDVFKLMPADGDFTCCLHDHVMNGVPVECDRLRCATILAEFLKKKKHQMLVRGFIHRYRQLVCLISWLSVGSLERVRTSTRYHGNLFLMKYMPTYAEKPLEQLMEKLHWTDEDDEQAATSGRSLIYYAVMMDEADSIRELLEEIDESTLNSQVSNPETAWGERKFTPLMVAMVFGRFSTNAQLLLDARADADTEIVGGDAFTLACTYGRADNITRWLAHFPAWDVNKRTTVGERTTGNTPLMSTAMQAPDPGATQVARVLLNAGADINATNEYGMNALQLACKNSNIVVKLVSLLLKSCVLVDHQAWPATSSARASISKARATRRASAHGDGGVVTALEADMLRCDGSTALMLAVVGNKVGEASLLMRARANPSARNGEGQTALEMASDYFGNDVPKEIVTVFHTEPGSIWPSKSSISTTTSQHSREFVEVFEIKSQDVRSSPTESVTLMAADSEVDAHLGFAASPSFEHEVPALRSFPRIVAQQGCKDGINMPIDIEV